MRLEAKMRSFVANLSNQEITEQLNDILEWARMYKCILEDEWNARSQQHISSLLSSSKHNDKVSASNENHITHATVEVQDPDSMQVINKKLEGMSDSEILANLRLLKLSSATDLTAEQYAQLQLEIEACELHLLAIGYSLDEEIICLSCGKELPLGAVFCTRCGARLS